MIYLPSVINIEFEYDTTSSVSVENKIFEHLKEYLSNTTEYYDNTYNKVFDYYLKNLYKYKMTYDYTDISDIDKLNIKVIFELK
jgi:hypothetical protein